MGDYLKLTKVEVISGIDLEGLNETLKWLVSKGNQKTIADALLQDQIDALRRENNGYKDVLAQLQSKQEELESRLDAKQDRDQGAADASAAASSDAVADLERRLADLEQRVEQSAAQTAAAAERDAADDTAASQEPAGPDLGSQLQELLAGHRALAATVSGLQNELESKPSRSELDQKANRSELDALLHSGVGAAAASNAGKAAPLEVAADGSVDSSALAEAVNKAAAEVAALRGQLAVLQDRMHAKAEQSGLDDLASQVAALRARVAQAAAAAPSRAADEPGQQPAALAASVLQSLAPTMDSLKQRLDDLEMRVAAAGASAAAADDGSSVAAVDAIDTLKDVQPLLKDIYVRVDAKADRSALEDALRRLHDLAAALNGKADVAAVDGLAARVASLPAAAANSRAASPPAGPQSQQSHKSHATLPSEASTPQWIVSHELAETGPPATALDELRSQVTDLSGRVSKLESAAPAPPSTPPADEPPRTPSGIASRASGGLEAVDVPALQSALAALQGQLGELGTRLAGKADAGEVARLELALNSKADLDELAELRLALGGKADAAALGDLQMAVAGKADQAALDEVKVTAALAADLAAGAKGDAENSGADGDDGSGKGSGGGGGYGNLLGAIQNMVADKATKQELAALQGQVAGKASADDVALLHAALDDKASAAELAALASQLSGRAATADEISSLDQRMGDVFAELAKMRADVAALPSAEALAEAAAGGGGASGRVDGGNAAALQRMMTTLSREVGTLREGLDTVAHAANVMAVGLDGTGVRGSVSGLEVRGSESGAAGKENRSPRGGYERLVKLLGTGEYHHKMDAFDPMALQQMAQKLAFLEATMKSPAMGRIGAGGMPGGVDYGMKELERQVKRLATDVRLMKDKVMEPIPVNSGRHGLPPGDHAMLAGRPITGYRCMACDRPLDQLDNQPGPYIPTQQLPVRVPAMAPVADAIRPQARSGRGDPLSPQTSSQRLQYNNDPNVRAVQNWYKDTQGLAAEALPREHVGPHLPPGGWRPSNPGLPVKGQASLPQLSGQRSRGPQDYDPRVVAAAVANGQPVDGANVSLPQIS
ncbi:hypothetical protein GPECTOR_1g384 [Gonium pectorale]|uniref:Uncharacterized protein n=1 Tax=Gonium pectorale TaxID=33097 RepID=A0A150H2Y1_GONPE|nr:hypothetical protein GPECTOR_1g384 [Gonium pectorale]|eukprot:KXZ56431.1 hypothetical protein GPECTOR_1g384 [Gonium pectorale]